MRVGERDGSSLDWFASVEDARIEVVQGFQSDVVRGAVPVVADEEPGHWSSQFSGHDELSDFVRRQGAVRVCAFICEFGRFARVPWPPDGYECGHYCHCRAYGGYPVGY